MAQRLRKKDRGSQCIIPYLIQREYGFAVCGPTTRRRKFQQQHSTATEQFQNSNSTSEAAAVYGSHIDTTVNEHAVLSDGSLNTVSDNCLSSQCSKRKANGRFLQKRVQQLLEDKAAARGTIEKECKLKSHSKTTFGIAFNSDGSRMATLHGDHTIRIIEVASGRNIQTLVGHPRSPWTVDFHKSHTNILASGCLDGQVRIWDLTSGVCDIWNSPSGSTITSLALHPTEKLLIISESHNVHIWNWETSTEPILYASSKRACEKVRWVKFSYTGDMFYTGITASAEYDSWTILRQAPSAFEMRQQRNQRDSSGGVSGTTSRARNQYNASLNATVSLGEMLGNPLEISNDLLVQPTRHLNEGNSNSVDVYHAATTFAQLHRIHTGESTMNHSAGGTNITNSIHNGPNLSRNNYLNRGSSPRRPPRREMQEGRFDTTEVWSPRRVQRQGGLAEMLQPSRVNQSAPSTSSSAASSRLSSMINTAGQSATTADSSSSQTVDLDANDQNQQVNITRIPPHTNVASPNPNQTFSTSQSQSSSDTSVLSTDNNPANPGVRTTIIISNTSDTRPVSSRAEAASSSLASSGIAAALLGSRVSSSDSIAAALRCGNDEMSSNSTVTSINSIITSITTPATTNSQTSQGTAALGNSAPPPLRPAQAASSNNTSAVTDDTVFGVSLRRGLVNNRPTAVFNPNVRSLVTSRPPIRRLSVQANFEPNTAVEVALAVQRDERLRVQRSDDDALSNEVMQILNRLEGQNGSGRHDTSIESILDRVTQTVTNTGNEGRTTSPLQPVRVILLKQLCAALEQVHSRYTDPSFTEEIKTQLRARSSQLNHMISAAHESRHVANTAESSQGTARADDSDLVETSAGLNAGVQVTDSSTNTEPVLTRSFGVSTEDHNTSSHQGDPRHRHVNHRPRDHRQDESLNIPSGYSREEGLLVDTTDRPAYPPYPPYRLIAVDSSHSSLNRYQRIQRWKLADAVENLDNQDNIIVLRCKIHSDAGVDISQDGTILGVFVKNPNTAQCPGIHRGARHDTMLRLISLREDSLGVVLHQVTLTANPASLSISPLNGYVIVGWRSQDSPGIKYDVYKVPPTSPTPLKMARSVYMARPDHPMAIVNCVRWLPSSGQGIVIGTNNGSVIICHNSGSATVNLNMSSYDTLTPTHFIL